jgi:asparagine synthase (glutamine-hydrolysing)
MNPGFYGALSAGPFIIPGAETRQAECLYYAIGHQPFEHTVGGCALFEFEGSVAGLDGLLLDGSIDLNRLNFQGVDEIVSSSLSFSRYRGAIQGVYFNAREGRLFLHGDFGRQRPIFYYHSASLFVFASSLQQLQQLVSALGVSPKMDDTGAMLLLTYSSIPGEGTLLEGFKKLGPAATLEFYNQRIRIESRFDWMRFERSIINERQAIDLLHDSFSSSLRRMSDYNSAHQHEQYNMLSGGIDSRMVLMGTVELRKDIHTICFSKRHYLDELISAEIARDFQTDHAFVDLGDGAYMTKSDSANEYDGTINYLASAHHRYALHQLSLQNPGVLFSGQLGNELLHDFYAQGAESDAVFRSLVLFNAGYEATREEMNRLWQSTPAPVQFKLLHRSFVYTNSASYSTLSKAFLMSPFVDPDFVSTALSLHPSFLTNHRIYLKWMARVFPQAMHYKWERFNCRPILGPQLDWAKWYTKVMIRCYHKPNLYKNGSMSPIDYWYKTNRSIVNHFDSFVLQNRDILPTSSMVRRLVGEYYPSMNAMNKAAVYTLLHQLRTLLPI